MPYTAEAFQNEFLALGATEVNAIVTVTSSGAAGGRRTTGATEIIIVDASGSMQAEGRRVRRNFLRGRDITDADTIRERARRPRSRRTA